MYKTLIIATDDGKFELYALLTNKGYEMPSLIEKPHATNYVDNYEMIADNPTFLKETLLPALKECLATQDYNAFLLKIGSLTAKEGEDNYNFVGLKPWIADLVQIIEEGDNMGFFNHQL